MRPQLVFVYNADSGLFNTATDIAHKLLSPSTYACNLCALTHDTFKVREEWTSFLNTLDADLEFLHRDEFHKRYPHIQAALPAVFKKTQDRLEPLLDAETLRNCESLTELKQTLISRLR
jgi:hypothetical protein